MARRTKEVRRAPLPIEFENEQLKQEVKALKQQKEKLQTDLTAAWAQYNDFVGLNERASQHKPEQIRVVATRRGQRGEATAVMQASDWHVEESVPTETVNGLNEYSLETAKQRAANFFTNGLNLVTMCRCKDRVETLVLALLGDFIHGDIHEENRETCNLAAEEAEFYAYELLCSGIDFLLDNGEFKKIIIPCAVGNHARTTAKPRYTNAVPTSRENNIYKHLQRRYKNSSVLQFILPQGQHTRLDVYGFKLRCHHGDGIQYQGGVGGIEIPLNKSIAMWDAAIPADIDLLGHWHTRRIARKYSVNGSLIGYTPYSIRIKAPYEEPSQNFFLLHPRYGKTVECPIYVK